VLVWSDSSQVARLASANDFGRIYVEFIPSHIGGAMGQRACAPWHFPRRPPSRQKASRVVLVWSNSHSAPDSRVLRDFSYFPRFSHNREGGAAASRAERNIIAKLNLDCAMPGFVIMRTQDVYEWTFKRLSDVCCLFSINSKNCKYRALRLVR
jgi:hypothetical protein